MNEFHFRGTFYQKMEQLPIGFIGLPKTLAKPVELAQMKLLPKTY
jgi:hypothetical protein